MNMGCGLVSILVPVYNVESYLSQCINSFLNQTYTNLQIVLIDDGSKDGSWDVMQEYAAKDSRVEIYHQENQGVASTRNHLLEKVKGDYVLFVDSDDWIESDMVDFLLGQMLSEDADMVTCSNVINDEPVSQTEIHKEVWNQDKVILEFLRHITFNGSLWNKLVKTSLLHNLRFHCGISYGEDALFCWGILQNTRKIVITDKQLYHYRMNDGSLSHGSWSPDKKGTGHLVWKQLADDTVRLWPQYSSIAMANYAISDMWQLYYASLSGYPKDENIRIYQNNLRTHLCVVFKSGLINIKKMCFAVVASYCYRACKFLA